MATVLECVAVPRASPSPAFSSPAKLSSSSVNSISGRRKLAEFKGLKVRPVRSFGSVSQGPSSRFRLRRGAQIVCEAQNTAVEGQNRHFNLC